MIKPIKPQEVIHTIPDFIIEAVNGLIPKKLAIEVTKENNLYKE